MVSKPRVANVDFSKIFWLKDADLSTQAPWLELASDSSSRLEAHPIDSLFDGTFRPRFPVVYDAVHGSLKRPWDLVFATIGGYVVSNRFIDLLSKNKFTGWRAFPVEIRMKNGEVLRGFSGLSVTGRCGRIHNEGVKPYWSPPPTPRGCEAECWKGRFFDEGTWDGTDVFLPQTGSFVLVTEQVEKAIRAARLSNVGLLPLSEMESFYQVRRDGKQVEGKQRGGSAPSF